MEPDRVVREYLLLGLRLDRLLPGLVDSFTGDPALRRQVVDEPRPAAADLARAADALRRELAGLPAPRRRFLDAHLAALAGTARRLAGQPVPFRAELEVSFQVSPVLGDPDRYREAHRALAELLPGDEPLARRLADFRGLDQAPRRRLTACLHALSEALRDRVRAEFGLPADETVEYQVVGDRPWRGFNHYLGGHRSRVSVNGDLGHRLSGLAHLVAHEAYPGHHTEQCRKEDGVVRREPEHAAFLLNTPRCLVAEGAADLGLHAAVGPGWGAWTEQVLAEVGVRLDGELTELVERAAAPLAEVSQDAALLLHDRGADPDDVLAHLRRWLLAPEPSARQILRFAADPLWRAYTTTYVEGGRLVRAWLDLRAPGEPVADRYRRLLDEPLLPADLRAELAAAGSWLAVAGPEPPGM
jgi:hypothetical protein